MRFVMVFILLLLAGLTAYLAPLAPALSKYSAVPQTPQTPQALVLAGVTPEYVGYHQKGPEKFEGLTDTILVLYFMPQEKTLRVVSIPRDTLVQVPGWGGSKVNSANVRGGPDMMRTVISGLIGVPIDGVVLVSLGGVKDVTNALGGVVVDVPQEMKYQDTAAQLNIDLKPGVQKLDGEQAEGFLRFRHDRLGDIGRVQRQQQFLQAFMETLRSPAGLYKLPQVFGAGYQNTRINLSREAAGRWYGALLSRPQLEMVMLPGRFANYGASFWDPDEAGIQDIFNARGPVNPLEASITIMNVGAPAGAARRLKARLDQMGYRNVQVSDLRDGNPSESVVITPQDAVAQKLQQDTGQLKAMKADAGLPGVDATIKLGSDWKE
ncbi:LCP family protein [Deinococcus cellulosilyticus]|uniref:Membrane protein n=1 Tax=Deinococcus cellulosilyticus (strain DSM 18568 / NBRC 106333 / KACC 11606 / 5516J-15) TaxID=1223518 RepID=A0A511MXS7_DEIC1|nr:LCP family protein [Deinococcus cellulosilyticus]GEM45370.1 membrane protein [Deinococcus cellulosilyticus NBRC 106333 = KACC 11606]